MRLRFLAVFVVAAALPAQAGLDRIEQSESAYARRGVQHARCSGTVIDSDSKPLRGARVLVMAYVPFYWALPLAEATTDEKGRFAIDDVTGNGRLAIWVMSPSNSALVLQSRGVTLVSGRSVQLPPLRLGKAAAGESKTRRVRGILRARNKKPIAGAHVRFESSGDNFDPGAYAVTAADGSFELVARTGTPESMSVFLANRRVMFRHKAGQKTPSRPMFGGAQLDLSGDLELDLNSCVSVPLGGSGASEFAVWREGKWFDCGDSLALNDSEHASATVRASVDGKLPTLVEVKARQAKVEKLGFDRFEAMKLRVNGPAGPVAGALVDVALIRQRGNELEIARLRTKDNGEIEIEGDPAARYAIYVYADGFAAARSQWTTAKPSEVLLQPLEASLTFAGHPAGSSLFVRPRGRFEAVASAYCKPGQATTLGLARGHYEVTRYGPKGCAAAVSLHVDEQGKAVVAADKDDRPRVTVSLPEHGKDEQWWVHGGRSAIGGMVRKWRAHSGGRNPVTRELVAESRAVKGSPRSFELTFPTSGRYSIVVGHEKLDQRFFCDVDLEFGKSVEIALPKLDTTIDGSTSNYPELWGMGAQHGIAGPRLMLLPTKSKAPRWGLLFALPDPAKWTLRAIPSGQYSLHHHLYETGMFSSEDGVWGGRLIDLEAGKPYEVGALGKAKAQTIELELVSRRGANLEGQLSIRDRMYESWSKVVERGTTLRNAMDAIPQPPSVVVKNGRAQLPRCVPGVFELELRLRDGRLVRFARLLTAESSNRIVLDV